jgi:hypothetical protein
MTKLISLQEYIEAITFPSSHYREDKDAARRHLMKIKRYLDFLKRPLTLDMFTGGAIFKDINVQHQKEYEKFYGGIRVYNHHEHIPSGKWFSEVFVNGKPTIHQTISDLTKYHIEFIDGFEL